MVFAGLGGGVVLLCGFCGFLCYYCEFDLVVFAGGVGFGFDLLWI